MKASWKSLLASTRARARKIDGFLSLSPTGKSRNARSSSYQQTAACASKNCTRTKSRRQGARGVPVNGRIQFGRERQRGDMAALMAKYLAQKTLHFRRLDILFFRRRKGDQFLPAAYRLLVYPSVVEEKVLRHLRRRVCLHQNICARQKGGKPIWKHRPTGLRTRPPAPFPPHTRPGPTVCRMGDVLIFGCNFRLNVS